MPNGHESDVRNWLEDNFAEELEYRLSPEEDRDDLAAMVSNIGQSRAIVRGEARAFSQDYLWASSILCVLKPWTWSGDPIDLKNEVQIIKELRPTIIDGVAETREFVVSIDYNMFEKQYPNLLDLTVPHPYRPPRISYRNNFDINDYPLEELPVQTPLRVLVAEFGIEGVNEHLSTLK